MLSIRHCQKILNQGKHKLNGKETEILRDFLYQIASLDVEKFRNQQDEKSSPLYKSFDRRTEEQRL